MDDNTNAITKTETGLVQSKLDVALAQRAQAHNTVLALDYSGSMASLDANGERRIDALRAVVTMLRSKGITARQLIFSNAVAWSDVIPEPAGGTDMLKALQFCAQISAKHIVLVSDGEPTDATKDAVLDYARTLGAKIDAYYVGDKHNTAAIDFMAQLATNTGGLSGAVSFKELGVKIAGALAVNAESAEGGKSIAL